jgi:hypothetical protein
MLGNFIEGQTHMFLEITILKLPFAILETLQQLHYLALSLWSI